MKKSSVVCSVYLDKGEKNPIYQQLSDIITKHGGRVKMNDKEILIIDLNYGPFMLDSTHIGDKIGIRVIHSSEGFPTGIPNMEGFKKDTSIEEMNFLKEDFKKMTEFIRDLYTISEKIPELKKIFYYKNINIKTKYFVLDEATEKHFLNPSIFEMKPAVLGVKDFIDMFTEFVSINGQSF